MVDVTDDAKGGAYRRVEVLTGPGRRRKWSSEAKARIVAEALAPGGVVADVARRWQVCPQQVFGWGWWSAAWCVAIRGAPQAP